MKMNRRSLLKLLGLAPLVAVLPVKAARKITNVDVGSATPEQLRGGQLWVLVGKPKTGKSTLAKVLAEQRCNWQVIDEPNFTELKNICLLHGYGNRKNRIVVFTEKGNDQDTFARASRLYRNPPGPMADLVIRVEAWNCHQDSITGEITRSWRCRILTNVDSGLAKDRNDPAPFEVRYIHVSTRTFIFFSTSPSFA